MPNFIEIGGVTRKPLVELTRNDPYTDSSLTVHLHKESENIRIKRGVRQGDTISTKQFSATLESVFRRLNWENKGVKIDGECVSNIRFADDIFLCTETPQELLHKNDQMKVGGTKRYNEESWQAGRHTPDTGKSSKHPSICLKRQVYNSCVLPAMTYGAETWTLTKQAQNKLAAAQTKMERSMLNITYR